MRITDDIVPREWANTAFTVLCALAGMFWGLLVVIVGALAGFLPREWVRAEVSPDAGAAVAVLVLVAAVTATVIAITLWREDGDGRG